jgi:hypothetical protein
MKKHRTEEGAKILKQRRKTSETTEEKQIEGRNRTRSMEAPMAILSLLLSLLLLWSSSIHQAHAFPEKCSACRAVAVCFSSL